LKFSKLDWAGNAFDHLRPFTPVEFKQILMNDWWNDCEIFGGAFNEKNKLFQCDIWTQKPLSWCENVCEPWASCWM